MTYPSGEVITTTYTARGLPDTLTGAETYVAGATYDAAGRLQTLRSGPPATPNARQDLAYTYDLTGNVATIMDAGAATTYGYDALARLTTVAGQVRYTYDPTGNLLHKVEPDLGWDLTLAYTDTAPIHAPREVSDPALGFGYELEYDQNGNLIQALSNQNTDSFTWDAENRLAQRTTQKLVMQWYACPDLPDDPNPCVPGWRATWQTTGWDAYTRDAAGNVLRRTDATGQHLYIGGHYELHAGAAISYYHFGGRRIALRAGTGSASYLLADHLGSTRVVEAGNGASAQHYTPWGEIVEGGVNTLPTEYTYTGQREASATGGLRLLDYGARHYAPWLGRFISPDSIVPSPGDPQSLNRYAYVLNNPLRYTDPTGHYAFEEDPSDPWVYSDPQVHSQYYYTHPEYTQRQPSDAEIIGTLLAVPVVAAGVAAAPAVAGAAFTAAQTGWAWLAGTLGLACGDGDCTNEVSGVAKQAAELSSRIKPLPPEIAATFENGEYKASILEDALTVYRAEGTTFGRWFGTIKPDCAAAAEQMYNAVTYGNDLTQVSTYKLPAGTVIYEGLVAGGTGVQIFVENTWNGFVQLITTQPLPQWGF